MRNLLIILFLLQTSLTMAQRLQLTARTGYGFYRMSDLQELQIEMSDKFPVNAEITESFPAYWYYEFAGRYKLGTEYFVGASVGVGSTGGRIHYSDYSGHIGSDQRLRFFAVGLIAGTNVNTSNENFTMSIFLKPTIVFTNLYLRSYLHLEGESSASSFAFKSVNMMGAPGVSLNRNLGKFGIECTTEYHISIVKGNLVWNEYKNLHLINDDGDPVPADWSGIRIAIGLTYTFGR